MRFQLIGKTRAKLTGIDIESLKQGQTELLPAVTLTFACTMPNHSLDMIGPNTLAYFYERASQAAEAQAVLAGIPVVSDRPQLTDEAKLLGSQGCGKWEQTGCTLQIYQGVTGAADIPLHDGTVSKLNFSCKEGGTVEWKFDFYTADVNAETLGDLGVLKNHELDIELFLPAPLQKDLPRDEAPSPDATDVFVGAHAETAGDGNPFGDNAAQDDPADAPVTRDDVFPTQPSTVPVTTKRRRGLGTDADQAERQARELAKDPSMAGEVQ